MEQKQKKITRCAVLHNHVSFKHRIFLSITKMKFHWLVQLETRNFGHHCQYTVKKCTIGFTLLISMISHAIDVNRKYILKFYF
jgi:hypothetical protein